MTSIATVVSGRMADIYKCEVTMQICGRQYPMYAFIIDPLKEEKIKSRIMKVLKRKQKGQSIVLRQSKLHKIVGCSIRAAYLGYLLETLQEEQKIMKDGSGNWSLWDSPHSVARRARLEQLKRKWEEERIEIENSPAAKAERAWKQAEERRKIMERFNANLVEFLCDNEEELFELICRISYAYQPREIKLSMINF